MERQIRCFLAPSDRDPFLDAVDAIDPGLIVLPGRFVDAGDGAAILADPDAFEFRQGLRSERRLYLAHRRHTERLVLHPQEEGPLRGWWALDPLRSEVFELSLPAPRDGALAPARLAATVLAYVGYERVKKSPAFGRWVGRVLRALAARYPRSSVDFLHVAPGAIAFAAGGGRLTYLEEPVLPAPHRVDEQAQHERIRS